MDYRIKKMEKKNGSLVYIRKITKSILKMQVFDSTKFGKF